MYKSAFLSMLHCLLFKDICCLLSVVLELALFTASQECTSQQA